MFKKIIVLGVVVNSLASPVFAYRNRNLKVENPDVPMIQKMLKEKYKLESYYERIAKPKAAFWNQTKKETEESIEDLNKSIMNYDESASTMRETQKVSLQAKNIDNEAYFYGSDVEETSLRYDLNSYRNHNKYIDQETSQNVEYGSFAVTESSPITYGKRKGSIRRGY